MSNQLNPIDEGCGAMMLSVVDNELLALVAHELRNPLSAVVMAIQVIKRASIASPAVQQAIATIDRQTNQLTRLVDDLTDVTRLVTHKIMLQMQVIQINEVCEHAVEATQSAINLKHHTLKVDLPQIGIIGDPVRLQQAIANVLSNAAKFTPKGGIITLTLASHENGVKITVEDNGIGIKPESLSRVCEMFFQEKVHNGSGLGIGLTLAKNLVDMHEGSIVVESAGKNQGSKVSIYLPLKQSEDLEKGVRVLVIDDNEDHANNLCLLLSIENYPTRVAYNGPNGLQEIKTYKPDVVFLDIGMPEMDGYEVMSMIHKNGKKPYVVAITGFGQAGDKAKTKAAGFDAHIIKPPKDKELFDILAMIAGQK